MIAVRIVGYWLVLASIAMAQVSGFVESFSQEGPYSATPIEVSGLENSDWLIDGNGEIGWSDGGLRIVNSPSMGAGNKSAVALSRLIPGGGSFRLEVSVGEVFMGNLVEGQVATDAGSRITVEYNVFHEGAPANIFLMDLVSLQAEISGEDYWSIAGTTRGGLLDGGAVPAGSSAVFGMSLDTTSSNVSLTFSNGAESIDVGPVAYRGDEFDAGVLTINFSRFADGHATGILQNVSLLPLEPVFGDFNFDAVLDQDDLDLLTVATIDSSTDSKFDLTKDGVLNFDDREQWVRGVRHTYFGDANLDGEFASSDLVNVFTAGEYEDDNELNSTWATGDWNGDGDFTTSDLVVAFQDGGYEQGPRLARSVPEPTGLFGVLLGAFFLANLDRRPQQGIE